MSRTAFVRSLITGLGLALAATACAPDTIAGPQAQVTTPAATVTAAAVAQPAASVGLNVLGGVLQTPPDIVRTAKKVLSDLLFPVVQRKHALAHSITVSKVIGSSGGSLAIPVAGLKIMFAPGALRANTLITVTADAGSAVSYEFGPHGTQFYAPVTIRQNMRLTTLANKPGAAGGIRGGYTANGVGDIVNGLLAKVAEVLNARTTVVIGRDGRRHLNTSSFVVKHFSGYILISV